MKITQRLSDDRVLLVFDGRLDASWSDAAAVALEGAIRSGRTRIELDLAAVSFITSVGIGTIVRAYARFKSVQGTLAIVSMNDAIREMLRVARLDMLVDASHADAPARDDTRAFGHGWRGELAPCGDGLALATVERVRGARIELDAHTCALGHLALANTTADAHGLYGEGIAAGGTVAVLPASAPRADCLVSSVDGAPPEHYVGFMALDALVVRGKPAFHGHFERTALDRITLRAFAAALCETVGGPTAFVAIGESGGAFGAWARTSPDGWPSPPAAMNAEELRANLRFAGDPMHAGESLAVVAIACPKAAAHTLPSEVASELVDAGSLLLHAHVATVSYRPVTRATNDLAAAGLLLGEQPLRSVMHALFDERANHETTLVRGAVWAMRIGGAR
ncbi:MAG: STAS domain-containing protein [Phycisphaerales bacterium]